MRSKRLRTTEEPVGLDGTSALKSSKRKSSGGPPGPKVRRSVAGTTCKREQKEKKKEAESKHNQSQSSVQLSGKKMTDDEKDTHYFDLCSRQRSVCLLSYILNSLM